MPSDPTRVLIFDTTLRDGEQSPGATMTALEKVRLARELEALGVDVIEAGFPVSSPHELRAVAAVAAAVTDCVVAALARAVPGDVEKAAEALEGAHRGRIHTFLATSDLHLSRKLQISRAEALRRIAAAVSLAREFTPDVEFSAEDATRTDPGFLCDAVQAALAAGATTINLPDTVGFAHPDDIARMFDRVRRDVPGIDAVTLSFHGHDDLGLATANSLAAIEHGARQVECTVNGIGERAGNAALEEVVMALRVLPGSRERFTTRVRAERLCPVSDLLAHVTGIRPQPNKAVVGANAFAHEAGIHQHGLLADARTYEIMTPAMVGARKTTFVLGKHSGRHALAQRYEELALEMGPGELDRAYDRFVMLADKKKTVHDEDLLAIYYQGTMEDLPRTFKLEHLDVRCGRSPSHAWVRVSRGDRPAEEAEGHGDGPVDATYAALDQIAPWETHLEDFRIRAAGSGKDAVGEVHVQLRVGGRPFQGHGVSTDVVDAAARAYLNALDKAEHAVTLEAQAFERLQLWGV